MARSKLKKKTRLPSGGDSSRIGELMNALPPELLARIFEIGAEPEEKDDDDAWEDDDEDEDEDDEDDSTSSWPVPSRRKDDEDENKMPFELLVASVCRQWREVALATPTLWASLWTALSPLDLAHGAIHLDVVKSLLQRTKGVPLDLAVDIHEVRLSEDEDVAPESLADDDALRLCLACFQEVVDHAWHWHDIEIAFNDEGIDHMGRFLDLLYNIPAAPLLIALSVQVEDPELPEEEDITVYPPGPTAALFGGVRPPRLSRTTIWGAPLGFDTRIQKVLFTGLRVLEFGLLLGEAAPTPTDLVEILRANPALEQLELHHCSPPPDDEWPPALPDNEVALPHLHELRLAGLPALTLHELFRRIAAPGLLSLDLGLDEEEAEFDADGAGVRVFFNTVITRHPGLQRLRLDGFAYDTAVLVPLFRALRAVEELWLELTPLNVPMLALLRYDPPAPATNSDAEVLSTVTLPKLHTLRLMSPDDEIEMPDLLDVLRTRAAALVPINHLFLQEDLQNMPLDEELRRYVKTVEYFRPEEYEDDEDEDEDGEWNDEDELDGVEVMVDDIDEEDEDDDDDDDDELDLLAVHLGAIL